ncbi:MAG TPA: helix-turn-helix transcriptional regulator [Gammaproteobacteria bacterium]|jgi:DNA-binding XRE family transcriptional regulator|nr:helix-turn-helix transcriptional regulator [Gammaproteobacteria bacterium]
MITTDQEKVDKKEQDIARGQRVEILRSMVGWTVTDLAKKTDVSRTTASFWENAAKGGLSEQGALKIISAIHKEGIKCTFEWLWEGTGEPPHFFKHTQEEPLISALSNALRNNPALRRLIPSIEREIEFFLEMNKNAVITKIDTNTMWPTFEFNDIVAGIWQPTDSLRAEKYCIVTIQDKNEVKLVKNIDSMNFVQLSDKPLSDVNRKVEKMSLLKVAPIIRIWR